jgi:uncharacterized protein YrrD
MLRLITQLTGAKLAASDGEIGHVKDFYFDDRNWTVRYVVVDTGTWLTHRQVLLSPHSLGRLVKGENVLRVHLTKKQIEHSPSIDRHKPVSRQYEEEYYDYYGWPAYWQGDGLWDASAFPILVETPPKISNRKSKIAGVVHPTNPDAHIHSVQNVKGYQVQATDGIRGYVSDFVMNSKNWALLEVIVKTGSWFSSEETSIAIEDLERISFEKSTIYSKAAKLEKKPAKQTRLVSAKSKNPFQRPLPSIQLK